MPCVREYGQYNWYLDNADIKKGISMSSKLFNLNTFFEGCQHYRAPDIFCKSNRALRLERGGEQVIWAGRT